MKRRDFVAIVGVAWGFAAHAQPPERVRRIGVLMGIAESDPEGQARATAFRQGLREVGLTEGRNLHIDFRWAAGDSDRMRASAAELVGLAPEVILANTPPAVAALRQQTRTIPIVFTGVSYPVGAGFVESLARPGGNITGFTTFEPAMSAKWLEVLKEVSPDLARVGLVFNPRTAPGGGVVFLPPLEAAARSFTVEAAALPVHDAAEVERTIDAFARGPKGGLIVVPDPFTTASRDVIISLAARHRLPAVYPYRWFAVSGGLISYGISVLDQFRRAGGYVDRILKGEKPSDLPVQAPARIELVINLRTARTLGVTIPRTLLARADEVIE